MKKRLITLMIASVLVFGTFANAQRIGSADHKAEEVPEETVEIIEEETEVTETAEESTVVPTVEKEQDPEQIEPKAEQEEKEPTVEEMIQHNKKDDAEEYYHIPSDKCPGHVYVNEYDYMVCELCGDSIPIDIEEVLEETVEIIEEDTEDIEADQGEKW